MTNVRNTALIAGATGAVAKRLVEHLSASGWDVVGLCRNVPAQATAARYIAVDLLDGDEVRRALAPERSITHVFYASRAVHGEGGVESVDENAAMLRHLIDGAEAASARLEHIHLVEGAKWYGVHLGAFPTPALEDDPRHMPPNFYYDQQDLLQARQNGQRWTWSASRPNVVCDFAPERPRNLVSIIGAYAAICRELGSALDFPGQPAHFRALTELTDASLLGRAMAYMATAPACQNQAFNVTNGDVFRWERMWPLVADYFGLRMGVVRPLQLAEWMQDKGPVWERIVARHALKPRRLQDVALWGFADFVFRQGYDVISSNTKLRLSGFHEIRDTREMLFTQLAQYREARIIP
jgi:nucleoside-diphosphate-sugar epimerase